MNQPIITPTTYIHSLRLFVAVFVFFFLSLPTHAQESTEIRITKVDIAEFPTVRLHLATTDARSAPIDLAGLSFRENGAPIDDYELNFVPVGVDILFVIDANSSLLEADGEDETPLTQVQASIERFARRHMSPAELDRISILVPDIDGERGQFLLTDATIPGQVIGAVQAYAPTEFGPTPLNTMMVQALEHAATIRQNGRFQAILLLTDAGQINRQLNYTALIEQANGGGMPIFAAILGEQATFDEIDNVAALSEPTRGTYVHMSTVDRIDPIYLTWQRQANQPRLIYESRQRQNGSYPLTLNVGQLAASAELNLQLEGPQATILVADTIERLGTAYDTPLADLQPAMVELPVQLTWPDGLPRQVTAVTLLVNDEPNLASAVPATEETADLTFLWEIRDLTAGTVSLRVQGTDELGFAINSAAQTVRIAVSRPDPPTPTPLPTPTLVAAEEVTDGPSLENLLLLLGVIAIVSIGMFWLRWIRLGKVPPQAMVSRRPTVAPATTVGSEPAPATTVATGQAMLVILEGVSEGGQFMLDGINITIGRDSEAAQIVLDAPTVSRLHARIRWRNGRYWLYDEGSARGTTLNYERLGLGPRLLENGDRVEIGRVALRFVTK